MPYCPACHAEYRPGIERCSPCEQPLVASLPETDVAKAERLREAVKDGEAIHVARASYAEACQMVEALHLRGVDAMVTGDQSSCGPGGQCGHFFVDVLPDDVGVGHAAMKAEWTSLLDESGSRPTEPDAAVDFDAEGSHLCPACGGSFEGAPEECPECGLFLGTPS